MQYTGFDGIKVLCEILTGHGFEHVEAPVQLERANLVEARDCADLRAQDSKHA